MSNKDINSELPDVSPRPFARMEDIYQTRPMYQQLLVFLIGARREGMDSIDINRLTNKNLSRSTAIQPTPIRLIQGFVDRFTDLSIESSRLVHGFVF